MKKNYTLVLLTVLIFPFTNSFAQCTGGRYTSPIFASYDSVMNVQYGANIKVNNQNQNLLLDIYSPAGDTETQRPLILIAHGGSFIGGSKTGQDVVPLCRDFVRMGYVVASVEYRLGIANFPFPGPDSTDASESVMRATQDARAAVRFFKKNVITGGNTYGVDTNNFFFSGVSAGAFMALHLAYLEDPNELPVYIDTTQIGLSGGMEGSSGNPGYNSDVRAIVNICGALGDTALMHAGDEPVCSFHGTNDGTVPYGSAVITLIGVYPLLQVDGSFSVSAKATELGIENCFETHEGQDHVPHTGSAQYYDTTKVIMKNFLSHFVCGYALDCSYNNAVGIAENNSALQEAFLYPNPASGNVTVDLSDVPMDEKGRTINFFDCMGRNVTGISGIISGKVVVNCSDISPGIYFVEVSSANHKAYSKLVIE